MDKYFGYLMFIFAGALWVYALILYLSKDVRLIPRMHAVSVKNEKKYAEKFAKVIAAVALAPFSCGVLVLDGHIPRAVIILITAFIIAMVVSIRDQGFDE